MKTQYFFLSIAFVLASVFAFGQKSESLLKKESIKVWGNCETCKKRIESAAKDAGAITANWDDAAKILYVKYDGAKTNSQKIQAKVALAGYDTQDVRATDVAYNNLPSCCRYDRRKG